VKGKRRKVKGFDNSIKRRKALTTLKYKKRLSQMR
jgi:hypothetical protein